jgi:hypothetical protein
LSSLMVDHPDMAARKTASDPKFPEVGGRLRALLDHIGGRQEDFAERVGVRRTEMNTALNGHNACKTSKWLLGIGATVGASAERANAYLRGQITLDDFTSGPSPTVDGGSEPVPMQSFLAWFHGNPAISAAAATYRDVTVQDMLRLRASPAREAESNAAKVYDHIKQLRRGDIGERLKVTIVQPDNAERRIKKSRNDQEGSKK